MRHGSQPLLVELVGDPVDEDGLNPWVAKDDLEGALGGRVPLEALAHVDAKAVLDLGERRTELGHDFVCVLLKR
jgi:hypothetical protein